MPTPVASCCGVIATFNVDHKSNKALHGYLANIAEMAPYLPTVIILDNLLGEERKRRREGRRRDRERREEEREREEAEEEREREEEREERRRDRERGRRRDRAREGRR
ncbi:PREDICTED: RNA-binding protein 25-like, partial [Priapulus caudatus]|uniref:RNA-binding protein 25-like n=1 Tax=Priapulus caudatus TaxID=37621 RepID=A0ABM1DUV5_PRICU